MNSIVVIIVYFGKLKPSFNLWLESAKRNSNIDFLLFIDDNNFFNLSGNTRVIPFSLEDFNILAMKKLGTQFKIEKAYKLCDFKPMYGYIFNDYIIKYNYWAFGDIDLIYGNILETLNGICYEKYKKINFAGHLCFMKNTKEMNTLFMENTPNSRNYLDIIGGKNSAFDEYDINNKAAYKNIDVYDGIIAADINCFKKRMEIVCGDDVKKFFNIIQKHEPKRRNYRHQLFVIQKGKVLRYYRRFLIVKKDEFCYLHFRRELPIFLKNYKIDTYLVSYKARGFFDINLSKINTLFGFLKIELILLLLYIVRNKFDGIK